MIPLSFASILGGTCTLIGTSTNLVVLGMLNEWSGSDGRGGRMGVHPLFFYYFLVKGSFSFTLIRTRGAFKCKPRDSFGFISHRHSESA